jgi:hypothetical protein
MLLAGFLLLVVTGVSSISYAQSVRFREFANSYPKAGDMAPTFILKTLDGDVFKLSEAVQAQPVVIEFGSYT